MSPKRIQRKRTKGWRMPEGAIYVGRPSLWGNSWSLTEVRRAYGPLVAAEKAVRLYERELESWVPMSDWAHLVSETRWEAERQRQDASGAQSMGEYARFALRGRDLVCWCPLDQPCHADVLLELANR